MLATCICTNCAGHLEFEEDNAGESISCPHCGFETTLFLPGMEPDRPAPPLPLWRRVLENRLSWGIAALLVLAGLGYALYHWGVPWVQELFPSIESSALAITILVLSIIALPFLVLWLILPLLLLVQVQKLSRAITRMAEAFEAARPEVESEIVESEEKSTEAALAEPPLRTTVASSTPPEASI